MAGGQPGWYPDPGGAPGQFRFWNGQSWSEALSPTPYAPPPTATGFDPLQPIGSNTGSGYGGAGGYGTGAPPTSLSALPPKRRFPIGAVLGVAALAVVLGLAGWFVVPRLTGSWGDRPDDPPTVGPVDQVCPRPSATTPPRAEHPNDGWVHGGRLAFPRLAPPWQPPASDHRVPFGRDVTHQFYTIHPDYAPGSDWGADVLVAELYAGDGFYSPQEGAEIVTRCILLGGFYADAVVTRNDTRNEAYNLDGYDAWIIQTTLSFEIKNLPTTSEDVTIIIVATGEMSSSLFYTSLPNDAPLEVRHDIQWVSNELRVAD